MSLSRPLVVDHKGFRTAGEGTRLNTSISFRDFRRCALFGRASSAWRGDGTLADRHGGSAIKGEERVGLDAGRCPTLIALSTNIGSVGSERVSPGDIAIRCPQGTGCSTAVLARRRIPELPSPIARHSWLAGNGMRADHRNSVHRYVDRVAESLGGRSVCLESAARYVVLSMRFSPAYLKRDLNVSFANLKSSEAPADAVFLSERSAKKDNTCPHQA